MYEGHKHQMGQISTRTPLVGSDGSSMLATITLYQFQPALPLWGVTAYSPMTPATEKFQPALPLRGVTVPSYGFGRIQPISTRTPLAGSDTRRCCTDTTCQEFQPALPCGE